MTEPTTQGEQDEHEQEGIHELADGRVAWFKDPDSNTFAVEQEEQR
ncbi:MAG: hypothetical protein ACRDK5_00780 [Solirubrobacterales bacterium]